MGSVPDVVSRVQEHRWLVERLLILACPILAVNHGAVEFEHTAEGVAHGRRLLVARHTTHAIQGQRIMEQLSHRIVVFPQVMGIEVAQGCVARRAFVLELKLVAGVDRHLMGHLGPPKRILGAVRHQRAPPLVRGVDVVAILGDIGVANRVCAMTPCAFSTAGEQRIGRVRKDRIRRHECPAVVRRLLEVEILRNERPRGHQGHGGQPYCKPIW